MNAARSIAASLVMGLTAYFGSITMQCMHIWLAVFQPNTWRWYVDITMYMWISSTVWLMEWIIGIRFRLFGDPIKENDRAIIIMNHRTRLDWLYLYGILMRYGWSICDEKIVLKHQLKRLPGAGWAMQCANYMFLRRNFQQDKFYLSNMLEYFCSMGHKTKILLFPEGTDLNSSSLVKSNQFAEKSGLPSYKYVLHPRTAGFVHLVQESILYSKNNGEKLDAIYDITVAYPDKEFATNELGFLLGKSSSEVHFLCRRLSLQDVVGGEDLTSEKLKDFILKTWKEKEDTLSQYYCHDNESGDKKENHYFSCAEQDLPRFMMSQWVCATVMCANMVVCIAAMIIIPKIFLPIFLLLNGVFFYVDICHNGVDDLAMRLSLRDKYREYTTSPPGAHDVSLSTGTQSQ